MMDRGMRPVGLIWVLLFVISLCGAAMAAHPPRQAAIASAHPLATEAGYSMLARGGNAFDAAVAVAAALAVVEPYSSGLGGGGFWLIHRARDRFETMIDARETAPEMVDASQYFNAEGRPLAGATLRGGTAAGIPGVPAGLVHLARRYGRLTLAATLAPAIRLARDGFEVDARYSRIAGLRERALARDAAAARTFLNDGRAPAPGYRLQQPRLAWTLQRIAREGAGGFYSGSVARELVASVRAAGGVWTERDLSGYRVVERAPLRFNYRGARVVSAALPSSGGVTLAQVLNILEHFDFDDPRQPAQAHLVVEALRRGFQDRARYLGDSDFVRVPVASLMDKAYARRRAGSIHPELAGISANLAPEARLTNEGANTTHYSIVDREGNRVAATLTINTLFGSGVVAGETGVLLNNQMDDFSLLPDVGNNYGLIGGAANAMAPRKRPLSSMTPTFVEDSRGVMVVGAPGGSRIISMVLLAILDYVHGHGVDMARLVEAPRYHHQYWPDRIEIEGGGYSGEWLEKLAAKGHVLRVVENRWGNMQVVFKARRGGAATAASDPRGAEVGWY